ncbi:MAG: DUF6055 domain-containing protein [Bacteroidota bacterium]
MIRLAVFLCFLLFSLSASTSFGQFTINDTFADLAECDTMTRGIYIIWWDNDFNLDDQVEILLDSMLHYRDVCLNELSMADPPNVDDGHYYNVYLHANGYFASYNWGNGQGTDSNGYPFLTLPAPAIGDFINAAHETFHIFQYNATSPGFEYAGDSQWYIEASANWFAARENPEEAGRFVEAESLVRLPHVPYWLSFDNFPDDYPQNWQRYVHQYALALHLYYLTDVVGVSEDLITEGLFNGTAELPQEYLYNELGGDAFRQYFVDWATHMTNNFDFIPTFQSDRNLQEWNDYADPTDDNQFVEVFDNEGTNGWFLPDSDKLTCAWSFNTYKLLNDQEATYTFELDGVPQGSQGDVSRFRAKLLVQNSTTGSSFYDLDLPNDLQGGLSLELSPEDSTVYFVIAAVPDVFEDETDDFQLFPYFMRITQELTTSIETSPVNHPRKEIGRYNFMGQKIADFHQGPYIIRYDDKTVEVIYPNE